MKFSLISSFVVLAVIAAIGTIDALPNPIRYVTPRSGTDYNIRIVTPNPRIRYLRSIDDEEFLTAPIDDLEFERRSVRSADEDVPQALYNGDDYEHAIYRRSPERVVINYKPPPPNGPRYARSADAEEGVNP